MQRLPFNHEAEDFREAVSLTKEVIDNQKRSKEVLDSVFYRILAVEILDKLARDFSSVYILAALLLDKEDLANDMIVSSKIVEKIEDRLLELDREEVEKLTIVIGSDISEEGNDET